MENLQAVIEFEAYRRHDERCAHGWECKNRLWHMNNDYADKAARDVVASLEAEISNIRARYKLR